MATWRLQRNRLDEVEHFAAPGDTIDPRDRNAPVTQWQAVRRRLADRSLYVARIGREFFVVGVAGLSRAAVIESIAAAASRQDATASAMLWDLLAECGMEGAHPEVVHAAIVKACTGLLTKEPRPDDSSESLAYSRAMDSWRQQTALVPGGDVWTERLTKTEAAAARPVLRKLSKLQRSILRHARDSATPSGAPLDSVRQDMSRSKQAALSRALARLEARGLLTIHRTSGRATRVRLTAAGLTAADNG